MVTVANCSLNWGGLSLLECSATFSIYGLLLDGRSALLNFTASEEEVSLELPWACVWQPAESVLRGWPLHLAADLPAACLLGAIHPLVAAAIMPAGMPGAVPSIVLNCGALESAKTSADMQKLQVHLHHLLSMAHGQFDDAKPLVPASTEGTGVTAAGIKIEQAEIQRRKLSKLYLPPAALTPDEEAQAAALDAFGAAVMAEVDSAIQWSSVKRTTMREVSSGFDGRRALGVRDGGAPRGSKEKEHAVRSEEGARPAEELDDMEEVFGVMSLPALKRSCAGQGLASAGSRAQIISRLLIDKRMRGTTAHVVCASLASVSSNPGSPSGLSLSFAPFATLHRSELEAACRSCNLPVTGSRTDMMWRLDNRCQP